MSKPNTEIPQQADAFVQHIQRDLSLQKKSNKLSLEKTAATYGIFDKTEVKELTELAIVQSARAIALNADLSLEEKYAQIVSLYQNQVTLSHRTSQSMLLQQYSTPAPIGFLMGIFCGIEHLHQSGGFAFEPSAGNGLLTIAAKPERVYVNEIDDFRRGNLSKQGYANVWDRDATKAFFDVRRTFAAIMTNPPFGHLDQKIMMDGFPIQSLEHSMAIQALDTILDNGKAAIIVGGHSHWDAKGRLQAGKNRIFFNYLYHFYNVADVLQIDGSKLYSRQGTSFNTRLILIDGRKEIPEGVAPVYNADTDLPIRSFEALYERVIAARDDTSNSDYSSASSATLMRNAIHSNSNIYSLKPQNQLQEMYALAKLEKEAQALMDSLNTDTLDGLGAPYMPASNSCFVLDTQVPDSMAFETQEALDSIRVAVGGDADNFVRDRLGYPNKKALCRALSAEQIDAVMLGIYNIEARSQGMIIGDQTGIGKGRVAAAMIRYACQQGLQPIFLTEKANLFSDIYRDLNNIGSGHLKPFIINGKESKTDIKNEEGEVVYQALPLNEQLVIFNRGTVPDRFDYVVATYTQFNSAEKKPLKPNLLNNIAEGNIIIMDESHNSSGSSNTGAFMQGVIGKTKGVCFLSATFAKRPDNMPIYAMKTAIADCNMSKDDLVEAIQRGGVALQEVLSAQLVAEGQMLRRERSFEGIEVNYLTLDNKDAEHRAIADNITLILRDIIAFQALYIKPYIEDLDNAAVAEGKEVTLREGTSQAGVDSQPYFSKVFNVINQMLFSIKAESVAERAILRLKEGKKPVIAFASTMGSFLDTLGDEHGLPIGDGSIINADFSEVLRRGLDGVLRYTIKDYDGKPIYKRLELDELNPDAQIEFNRINEQISSISTGITISPIDVVIQKIKAAGYTVAEVTGRKYAMQLNANGSKAVVLSRKKINTNDAFRQFNNNEVDVLMINQSGSTGASAHAIATSKVSAAQVQQRVMIVLQAELNISTEVQKRGRINRTGQILKPIYDYVSSAIPAEKRLMMMLQMKLKSLDANTASNQKQSSNLLDVPDFLNKYGDKVVQEYLDENPEINALLDNPLKTGKTQNQQSDSDKGSSEDTPVLEDAAHRVSGRVAVLSTQMQQDFYNDISERYNDYVSYLKQIGEYDLELEAMNLEAETIRTKVVKMGLGSDSVFGEDSLMETVMANVLRKPFSTVELDNMLIEALKGGSQADAKTLQQSMLNDYLESSNKAQKDAEDEMNEHYDGLMQHIPDEKKIKKIKDVDEQRLAITVREVELIEAKQLAFKTSNARWFNRRHFMERVLKFFFIGQRLYYPFKSFGTGESELVPTVFLGFQIDFKKKNPYTASLVKLRFALADSNKYLVLPLSFGDEISSIMGVSGDVQQMEKEQLLMNWDKQIQESSTNRRVRHVITGNLLQAFADYKGKLVSYTTIDGKVEKGILMPNNWLPEESGRSSVDVPIIKALPILRSLVSSNSLKTSNNITFIKQYDGSLKIFVFASKAKGGDLIYLDRDLLELVVGNNFSKTSDKMVAYLRDENVAAFVEILQRKHSCSVMLNSQQYKTIESSVTKFSSRKAIRMPKAEKESAVSSNLHIIELEAEALLLELQLMAA